MAPILLQQRKKQRGYALLMVLLGLVLLGLVAARFGTMVSTDVKLVRNLGDRAQLEILMETSILRVVDGLMKDRAAGFWRADGSHYRWQEQGTEISVIISDENSLSSPDKTAKEGETNPEPNNNKKLPENAARFLKMEKGTNIERVRDGNGLRLSERAIAKIEIKITQLANKAILEGTLKVLLTGPKQKPFQILGYE